MTRVLIDVLNLAVGRLVDVRHGGFLRPSVAVFETPDGEQIELEIGDTLEMTWQATGTVSHREMSRAPLRRINAE